MKTIPKYGNEVPYAGQGRPGKIRREMIPFLAFLMSRGMKPKNVASLCGVSPPTFMGKLRGLTPWDHVWDFLVVKMLRENFNLEDAEINRLLAPMRPDYLLLEMAER